MAKHALIIANGESPKKQLVLALAKEADCIICADGGANTALKYGIRPDVIIGDMDSIHAEALVKFHRVPMHEDSDQYSTDLEKAVAWAVKQKYDHIVAVGTGGKRVDHTVGNLGVFPKFSSDAVIKFVDDLGELSYVGSGVELVAKPGTIISLLPLNRCEGVTTAGLKYALTDDRLELGSRDGTSNVVTSSPIMIHVKKGSLLIYKLHAVRRKHSPW